MLPPLVDILTDEVIADFLSPDALRRGRDYAVSGKVVRVVSEGWTVLAEVQGTRPHPYQTRLRFGVDEFNDLDMVEAGCTCPLSYFCKHMGAALVALTMRTDPTARKQEAIAPVANWEQPLAALVAPPADRRPEGTPIGLQFEVVRPVPPRRYLPPAPGAPTEQPRIRIRPVVTGRNGGWIRTGVSWRDLNYQWRAFRGDHREVLHELYAAHQSKSAPYYSYADQAVHLDEFGPSLWSMLDKAMEVGVPFVPVRGGGEVSLSIVPAIVSLDARHPPQGHAAVLDTVVSIGNATLPTDALELIGRPAHGLWMETSLHPESPHSSLLLTPLDKPLSEAVARLIEAGERIEIPDADIDRFRHDYYPRLRQSIAVVSSDASVDLPEIEPPRLTLSVTYQPGHHALLAWGFVYVVGDSTTHVGLAAGDRPQDHLRDARAERELVASLELPDGRLPQLRQANGSQALRASVRLDGIDAVFFTTDVLPALAKRGDIDIEIVGEPPDYRWSEAAPLVTVSTTDTPGEQDWFDLQVTVSIDGESVPFQELFAALAKRESHLILESGTIFTLQRPEYDELRRLIDEAKALQDKPSDGLRVSPYQASLWSDLVKLGVVDEQSERWAGIVKGLLDLESIPEPELPAGLQAQLRPYQREGYSWLAFLRDNGLGGILADDMGLGKTLQALALIGRAVTQEPGGAPFLVVAPTSVVHNWHAEAARFVPGLDVVCIAETEGRAGTSLAERIGDAQLVVTSYALFRIEYDAYDALPWSGLVLDEAQFVKNHQAKTYQCARRLRAPFKLAITGTPLENSLMDLWSLLSIVAPGLFPNPQRFTDHFRKPIEKGTDPELLATLRRRIRPLMLRRTKEQVATELPPKQEQVLEVTLHPRHQKIYQTHLQRERQKVLGLIGEMNKNRFEIFRSLTLLRQLSLAPSLVDATYADVKSSKVEAFLEHIEEVVREGHRALVFSQFTGFLRLVRDRLDTEGIRYCYLDGRTRKRAEQISAFKDGKAPIFLISLKAGGFGLNLTEADYVFVLDPWWNPAVEAQAVDRTHRIGQDKTVMVYRLVASDTIEEKVMELKARKQDLFDKVMDDDALLSAPLTADDIVGLFGQ